MRCNPPISCAMRLLRICFCLVFAPLGIFAQTNEYREMSLEDCIEVALHHNLDIQIKRLNPELARFTLEGAFGAWDPSLYGGADHEYRRQPGSVDSKGRVIPGAEIETDNFTSGFQGLTPWGMIY